MAELIDKANENIINQLAMMYAVSLTKYGVDIREKFETATQSTMALNQAYIRGRQDEIEKFRVLQSGYEADIRAKAIDEFAEKLKDSISPMSHGLGVHDIDRITEEMKNSCIRKTFREIDADYIAEQLKGE